MLRQEARGDFKLGNSCIMSHINCCLWPYVIPMGKPHLLSSLRRNGTSFALHIKIYMSIYSASCWNCREKTQHEKRQILGNPNSPLRYIDLKVSYIFIHSLMSCVQVNSINMFSSKVALAGFMLGSFVKVIETKTSRSMA